MNGRTPFAYVVAVDGGIVTLNLKDEHSGQVAGHRDGISTVTEVGTLFGVSAGPQLLVMRVRALSFAEPREAQRAGVGTTSIQGNPLRNVIASTAGVIARLSGRLHFMPDSLASPALGAEAYPLSTQELEAILWAGDDGRPRVILGESHRGGGLLRVPLDTLLSRHVAVLGSTGQGKSCFTAAVLQELLHLPRPRVVLFDINGEYHAALAGHVEKERLKETVLGDPNGGFRVPYYALGRHGLARLLLPSERTQRPALNFALDHLRHTKWFSAPDQGAGLVGDARARLFDDARLTGVDSANSAIQSLRGGSVTEARVWPHMKVLGCLIAESQTIKEGRYGPERDAFQYGHVAPLITRIQRCTEDELFQRVVKVEGGPPCPTAGNRLSWEAESSNLVEEIFGGPSTPWTLHIVNLRNVAHDLMPIVLGALLELLAFEMFRRGQNGIYPTLLVLEEAHHYLRQLPNDDDTARHSLAYERLAKEGRKFGVSLWLSTQRPAEVSPTVLAQCGTWVVFRLTGEQDLRAVASASEWVDKAELNRIAGLPRREAVVFGSSIPVPTRVTAPEAKPLPASTDPDFSKWLELPLAPPPSGEDADEKTVSEVPESVPDLDDDVPF